MWLGGQTWLYNGEFLKNFGWQVNRIIFALKENHFGIRFSKPPYEWGVKMWQSCVFPKTMLTVYPIPYTLAYNDSDTPLGWALSPSLETRRAFCDHFNQQSPVEMRQCDFSRLGHRRGCSCSEDKSLDSTFSLIKYREKGSSGVDVLYEVQSMLMLGWKWSSLINSDGELLWVQTWAPKIVSSLRKRF